jgi:Beta-lactamase class C and other penicillin binding proteins
MNIEERIHQFEQIVRQAQEDGAYPGAVALVGQHDKLLCRFACGDAQQVPHKRAMEINTRFDLASLTKVTATLPLILLLLQQNKLQLETRLGEVLTGLCPENADIAIFELLTHTAGLKPFYDLYTMGETRLERIASVKSTPPETPRKEAVIYSDNSFVLLGEAAEACFGMPLNIAARTFVWEPLNMLDTTFNPPQDVPFAATEQRETYVQYGNVHDENCASLDGVAGHAGAFSTADDLAKYCRMLASNDENNLVSQEWLNRAAKCYTPGMGDNRGLGFVVYREREGGNVIGHTGFTGTAFWVDRMTGLYGILLTNRVHPTRANTAIFEVRKQAIQVLFD